MKACEVCGNQYDKAIRIIGADGTQHVFDSFECAIHAMAPHCAHCDMRIIGHGVERGARMFCCNHCAERADKAGSAGQDMTQASGTNVRSRDPAHGQQPSP